MTMSTAASVEVAEGFHFEGNWRFETFPKNWAVGGLLNLLLGFVPGTQLTLLSLESRGFVSAGVGFPLDMTFAEFLCCFVIRTANRFSVVVRMEPVSSARRLVAEH